MGISIVLTLVVPLASGLSEQTRDVLDAARAANSEAGDFMQYPQKLHRGFRGRV
jgi:hypothetical protein